MFFFLMIRYKKRERETKRKSFGTVCYFIKNSVTSFDESCGGVLFIDDIR